MQIHEVTRVVQGELNKVEENLVARLSSEVSIVTKVGKYVLRSGGKRFRPLVLLLSSKCGTYRGTKHIALACALEYIHTATLLHDDVIDHAQIRRGSSSVNSVWGNGISVVVGDFLLSKAFSLLVEVGNPRILSLLAQTTTRMSEGESHQQISGSNADLHEDEYMEIIAEKTASLISAASEAGAMLGKMSPKKQEALREYGLNLGVAFQITDDTLDYASKGRHFGKTKGKDLQERKVTLPLIHTLRESTATDREAILKVFKSPRMGQREIRTVAGLVDKYGGLDYALDVARMRASQAKANLKGLASSPQKEALLGLADYVVSRKW
jgi:octaprenyl-diphosphate synthase